VPSLAPEAQGTDKPAPSPTLNHAGGTCATPRIDGYR
jgi:hypothetical protein